MGTQVLPDHLHRAEPPYGSIGYENKDDEDLTACHLSNDETCSFLNSAIAQKHERMPKGYDDMFNLHSSAMNGILLPPRAATNWCPFCRGMKEDQFENR